MRILLLHNPTAGNKRLTRASLVRDFERARHDVVYQSVKRKGWKAVLDQPADLIVAAGGDGTVRRVSIALSERAELPGTPLVVLPLGTANNIARALGARGSPGAIAQRLPRGTKTRLAIGIARASWGETRFVEAAGVGAFATMLRETAAAKKQRVSEPRQAAEIEDGLDHLRAVARKTQARHVTLEADDVDLSGDFLLVEALNIASIGSCVDLGNANHTDDLLDLVLIRPEERATLTAYLEQLGQCERFDPPFRAERVRRVTVQWPAADGHVDDGPWPTEADEPDTSSTVTLEIDRWIPVLVPDAG